MRSLSLLLPRLAAAGINLYRDDQAKPQPNADEPSNDRSCGWLELAE